MRLGSSSTVPAGPLRRAARLAAGGVGLAALGYAAWTAAAWYRYGHAAKAEGAAADPLLDHFMPEFDVVERHHIAVDAPQELTMAAAREQRLDRSPVIRAIFKTRTMVMGGTEPEASAKELLPQMLALGWGVLAETPGEIVVGAVTRPWEANVIFTALPPDEFAAFNEPGFVKIVWSLRADPVMPDGSIFRTETRARATDAVARGKFRRYWALSSAGIALIRILSLAPLKADAERRWRTVSKAAMSPETALRT